MNTAKPATLIAVALLALSLGFIGCSKNPTKTTTLQDRGHNTGLVGDSPGGMIGNAPIQTGQSPIIADATPTPTSLDSGQGLRQPDGNFGDWIPNTSEFADQTVYFEYDKAVVKPSEIGKLKEVARRMKSAFQGKALRIEGHCDERGTEEYNRTLGDKRAQAIRELLASEGVAPGIMPTLTFGEDKPVDPGHNEEAYSKNRRGALVLLTAPDAGAHLSTGLGETKAPRSSE